MSQWLLIDLISFVLGVVVALVATWALPRLARWMEKTIGRW